jgi:hypothetical protein
VIVRGLIAIVVVVALATLGNSASEASGRAGRSPELTRKLHQVVQRECTKALVTSPVRFVCPPLVPVSKYIKRPGLYGTFNGDEGRAKITLLSFNGGDNGPGYWHWIAGLGTRAGVNRWVLSDAQNVVRGKPKLSLRESVDGREVKIWRFPPHPAGGQFGGHDVAITRAGSLFAVGSVHGESAVASARIAVALAKEAAPSSVNPRERFDRHGISFQYPASWFVTTERLSNAVNPTYRFTVSSHRVRPTGKEEGPCLPGIAAQLPPTAVLAYLREALGADRRISLPRLQPRPKKFRLPTRSDNALCGFPPGGRWVPFKSEGRAFYLALYVGSRAPQSRVQALARMFNNMSIDTR